MNPHSIALLSAKGHDASGFRSKSWDEFAAGDAPVMDMVITVCASAAGETCPIWPGTPLRAHWGVEDPAAAPEHEWDKAFSAAYDRLERRANALLALEFDNLPREKLQSELKRIGQIA